VRYRFDLTDTVTTSDGDHGKRFTVHTSVIIRSSSNYSKAALSHDPRQIARGRNIPVHGTDEPTLSSYLHWLYTERILEREKAKHYTELFAPYLLGDRLQDLTFRERVVEALVVQKDGFVWPPLQPDVSFVWERTSRASPLRRVVKEIWLTMPISMAVRTFQESPVAPFPMDFVLDLFAVLVKQCSGATDASFSGKTFGDLRDTCVGFVRDDELEEEEIRA
jgi:hypothetical protein